LAIRYVQVKALSSAKGAAGVVGAAAVGGHDLDGHRLQLGWVSRGQRPLHETEVAGAEGADLTVRPVLGHNPVGRRSAILGFGGERDITARPEGPAAALDDDVVATLGEAAGE